MADDPGAEIDTLRERVEDGERGGSAADRDVLLEFSDKLRLVSSRIGEYRHLKLMRHLTRISEEVNRDDVLAECLCDKSAAEDAVAWIHANYDQLDNAETNRDFRACLRAFGREVVDCSEDGVECDDRGIPRTLSWISARTPKNYDPSPDPAAMLTWDDVDELIDAARNTRDAAMVALMMDAGPRGGEFFDLEVGDLTDADHGLRLRVDGKTGARSVTLIPSVPHVNRWLADHPAEDGDKSAPLWSSLTEPRRLSRQRIYQVLDRLAERAEIDTDRKPVRPTNFRKSNASYLARTGANAALIEDRQGRTRGSDAVARYVAEFGEEGEQTAYARLHGREVDQETPDRRDTVECPRCGKANGPKAQRCTWCGQALTDQAAAEAEQTKKAGLRALAQLVAEEDIPEEEAADAIGDLIDTRVQAALDGAHD